MPRAPFRRSPGLPRLTAALLLIGIAFAVMVMHAVIAHCAAPEPGRTGTAVTQTTGGGHSRHAPITVIAATGESTTPTMSATIDCAAHQHACVFVRDDLPPLIPLIVAILLFWGFPDPRILPRWVTGSVRRLGQPPPWAMPSHLKLSVIRC